MITVLLLGPGMVAILALFLFASTFLERLIERPDLDRDLSGRHLSQRGDIVTAVVTSAAAHPEAAPATPLSPGGQI